MTIARPGARPLAGAFASTPAAARRTALLAVTLVLSACSVQVHRGGAAASTGAAIPALEPKGQRDAQHALFLADLHRGDSVPAGDAGAAAAARWFADDAVYLYPGLPVLQGREAVRAVLAQAGAGARVIRFQPLRVEVSRGGDFGYSVGYALRVARDSAARVRLDRYQAAWARTGDAWRIVAYSELPVGPLPAVTVADSLRYRAAQPAEGAAADAWAADRAFAADGAAIGTGAAFAKWAAADAMLGGGGGELNVGHPAILRAFGDPVPGASLVWGPVFARGAASGDLAVTVGEAVSTGPGPDGKPVARPTKYLTVWRRTPAGMRWVTDGGNPR
ncbi:MAG TPA: DUF4440 domain-containing protein [Gemmatimonadaceae bacterium]